MSAALLTTALFATEPVTARSGRAPAVATSEAEYARAACAAIDAHVPDTPTAQPDALAVCVRCGLPWPCPAYLHHRDALNCLYDPATGDPSMPHARIPRDLRDSAGTQPSAARIYDYLLGGSTNFGSDRRAAADLLRAVPSAQTDVWANRAFLRRVVRYLLGQGVRQFLDLGSGLPTVGNVHEIAHAHDPAARVVYVDSDPVAVAHAEHLLTDTDHVAVLEADLRDVGDVLNSPEVRDLLDFSHPIGLLAVAVLHFIAPADDPPGVLAAYTEALIPGSYLVVSHATGHTLGDTGQRGAAATYAGTDTPLTLRTPAEVGALFGGYDLIPPRDGESPQVVPVADWRPDPVEDATTPVAGTRTVYGGVGVLPVPPGSASVTRDAAPATGANTGARR